eukprot:m.252368 g.252368  ORF g.252368 m.252368 type:complete len:276 (-) comp19565_c0_seq2:1620-2447(-)
MMASSRFLVSVVALGALLMIGYIAFLEKPKYAVNSAALNDKSDKSDVSRSILTKNERADVESLFNSPSQEGTARSSDTDIAKLMKKIDNLESELNEFKASVGVPYVRQGKGPPNQINPEVRNIDPKKIPKHEKVYGGHSDAAHLGGFTANDTQGQSPAMWTFLLKAINVHSVLDVGCGRGISSKWFLDHGAEVLCVEGSSEAVKSSFLPPENIVQHDFSMGPYWPDKTYDFAWSVEVSMVPDATCMSFLSVVATCCTQQFVSLDMFCLAYIFLPV